MYTKVYQRAETHFYWKYCVTLKATLSIYSFNFFLKVVGIHVLITVTRVSYFIRSKLRSPEKWIYLKIYIIIIIIKCFGLMSFFDIFSMSTYVLLIYQSLCEASLIMYHF